MPFASTASNPSEGGAGLSTNRGAFLTGTEFAFAVLPLAQCPAPEMAAEGKYLCLMPSLA